MFMLPRFIQRQIHIFLSHFLLMLHAGQKPLRLSYSTWIHSCNIDMMVGTGSKKIKVCYLNLTLDRLANWSSSWICLLDLTSQPNICGRYSGCDWFVGSSNLNDRRIRNGRPDSATTDQRDKLVRWNVKCKEQEFVDTLKKNGWSLRQN